MIWRHFAFNEFKCKCGCNSNDIDSRFVTKLDNFREKLGFPFIVTSGYRCPEYNNEISGTGFNGPHTQGQAADILANRHWAFKIVTQASDAGFTGIGIKQHGASRFIHLDDLGGVKRPIPTIWSYP